MPLDSVKSVVYRSFITCDDPKGVVDCNIAKISKVNSQKLDQKVRAHRTYRNSNKGLVSQVEKEKLISKEKRERIHGQSSLPLMEGCQGAEKLYHPVGSWSKGMRSERKVEEIAEDLLEETSSLREKLIMLARLQDASNESMRLKMKYQKKFSCHLEDECFPVEVQRSKLSRHGTSKNGADEVKKVIRNSLVKQDSTRNITVDENKSWFRDINSDSGSEIPSTSSSQPSLTNDNVNCCHVTASQQKNLKHNNLIAKLMGLEEIPSRSVRSTPKKEFEFKKGYGCETSVFGNDATQSVPKSKSVINKEDPQKGTLREILQKMPVNRVIESDSDIEFKIHGSHSYNNGSKQRLKDVPPLVLIKHKPLPPDGLEEHRARVSSKEDAFNQKAMLRNTKKKEFRSFDDFDFHGRILSSDELHRKQEAEGISLKQISEERRRPKPKEEIRKLRKGIVDTKKKAAEKLKTSSPMADMPHETEPIDRKVLTSKKLTKATRKPVEKELAKEKVVSRSRHQEKVTSTIPRRNKTHKQRSSILDSVPGRAVIAISNDRDCQKKEEPVLPHSKVNSFESEAEFVLQTHITEAKHDDESTDTNETVDLSINRKTTTLMALLTMESEIDECDTKIIECCNENPNSLSPLSPKLDISTSIVKDFDPNNHTETDIESCNQGTNLKALLLRSSSFLCHAGELFDLNLNGRTMLQAASCCNDPESPNTKPFIDCAIELVERKGYHNSLVANSLLLGHRSNTKVEVSVEKLVKELSDYIETLTSYQTICGDNLLVDRTYAVLSRDLWCKEVMNGIWDFGWKNEFSRSDSEEVVNDIEKLILSGLIEESFR